MRASEKLKTTPEIDHPASRLSVTGALAQALTENAVNASELMECLYYAAEEDLLRIMRLVAALEPEQRVRVLQGLEAQQKNPNPA